MGCGKSTLLATIMQESNLTKGEIERKGRVAYVEQDPFILSDTVQNNVLFGRELDEDWMQQVVSVCQLEPDLELFPRGILTQIGEQGVNISGGQRARIALARAVYSRADIYLLDDPLSAVDPAVANQIFEKCVKGVLREKACILVTHQLHFLNRVPRILVLDNKGRQEFLGTY